MTITNRSLLIFATLFLVVVVVQPVVIHTHGRTIIDDGYYYLGYARNIAAGMGPTFDGIVETNGVQPLWALLLTGLAYLFPGRVALLYAMLALSTVLVVGSIFQLHRLLRRQIDDTALIITLLFFLAAVINPTLTLTGMETPLNFFVLVSTLVALWKLPPNPTSGRLLYVGVWIGACALARIDNLAITPALALLMVWRTGLWDTFWVDRNVRPAIEATAWLALPALVMFGSYLMFNQLVFDRWLPISGTIKGAIVESQRDQSLVATFAETTRLALAHIPRLVDTYLSMLLASYSIITLVPRLVVAGILAYGIVRFVRSLFRGQRLQLNLPHAKYIVLLVLLLATVFLHTWLVYYELGAHFAVPLSWYYVPEYITVTLLIAFGIDHTLRQQALSAKVAARVQWVLVAFLTFGALTYLLTLRQRPVIESLRVPYEVTQWANDNLSANVIAGSWNAGIVGYFTDLTIINLDGLMNNEDILHIVEGHTTTWSYIQNQSISHIFEYTSQSWHPGQENFRGIPTNQLNPIHMQDFVNWGFVPSTYYVFEIGPP